MKLISFLILLFVINWAQAGQYPVVIVTNSALTYQGLQITFYTKIMEVGPGTEQIVPPTFPVSLVGMLNDKNTADMVYGVAIVYGDGVKTLGQLAMEAYNKTPANVSSGTRSFLEKHDMDACLTWGAEPPNFSGKVTDIMSPVGCVYVPPTTNWCKVTTPDIILDHGTLSSSAADGDIAHATMDVECGEPAAVKFIVPGGAVYLDEGKSSLKVDDKALGSQIALPQGKTTLKISDSLEGVSSEGVHTGTSVLIMQPY